MSQYVVCIATSYTNYVTVWGIHIHIVLLAVMGQYIVYVDNRTHMMSQYLVTLSHRTLIMSHYVVYTARLHTRYVTTYSAH